MVNSVATEWFHPPARRLSGLLGARHWGLAEVELQRLHHQGQVSPIHPISIHWITTKMLESYHKLQPNIPELKDALQLIWSAQKSIDNAAVEDCRKRLQTCVPASAVVDILNIKHDDHIKVTNSYVEFVMSYGCNYFFQKRVCEFRDKLIWIVTRSSAIADKLRDAVL